MKRRLLFFLAASTLLAADKPSDATVKEEWKKLEGSWTLTRAEMLGKSLLPKDAPRPKMTIKDGKITSKDKAAPKDNVFDSSTIKLDPKADPKTITLPDFKGLEVPLSLLGIYQLKGDELKICIVGVEKSKLRELEKIRPKGFDSKQAILLDLQSRQTK